MLLSFQIKFALALILSIIIVSKASNDAFGGRLLLLDHLFTKAIDKVGGKTVLNEAMNAIKKHAHATKDKNNLRTDNEAVSKAMKALKKLGEKTRPVLTKEQIAYDSSRKEMLQALGEFGRAEIRLYGNDVEHRTDCRLRSIITESFALRSCLGDPDSYLSPPASIFVQHYEPTYAVLGVNLYQPNSLCDVNQLVTTIFVPMTFLYDPLRETIPPPVPYCEDYADWTPFASDGTNYDWNSDNDAYFKLVIKNNVAVPKSDEVCLTIHRSYEDCIAPPFNEQPLLVTCMPNQTPLVPDIAALVIPTSILPDPQCYPLTLPRCFYDRFNYQMTCTQANAGEVYHVGEADQCSVYNPSHNLRGVGSYVHVYGFQSFVCDYPDGLTYTSENPTIAPSAMPSISYNPSAVPTLEPSSEPTFRPSKEPTPIPSVRPTVVPSAPTIIPSRPTLFPTSSRPTRFPTSAVPTLNPNLKPTEYPTYIPTESTFYPTETPTHLPTESTHNPTVVPTRAPTVEPTNTPTMVPTAVPTKEPTFEPTIEPTSVPSVEPTVLTARPSRVPTREPTLKPSRVPTEPPTYRPTASTELPTIKPTRAPSAVPSKNPSNTPTIKPSRAPTISFTPTKNPTRKPTKAPQVKPDVATLAPV